LDKILYEDEKWFDFPHNYYNQFHCSLVSRYDKTYLPLQLLFIPSRNTKLRNYITYSSTSCLDKFCRNITKTWRFTPLYNSLTQSQHQRQWAHLRWRYVHWTWLSHETLRVYTKCEEYANIQAYHPSHLSLRKV
jgi:hypothetical protein